MKKTTIVVLTLFLFQALSTQAQAINDPPLFSCQNPIGGTIASYSTGVHGIPGDSSTHTGSDTVYTVDQNHVLQCFCSENNDRGIQSNWWKVSDLSTTEIDFFQRRGWVLVANGQAWGLDAAPYLVKNDSFSCKGTGGGGNSSSSGSDNGVGGGSSSTTSTGSILGTSTLAATGSAQQIAFLLSIGLLSAYVAYRLSRE